MVVVGVNYGTVNGCSFTGTIDGKAAVGGIAGVNENSGKIVNCTSAVTITATDETGGIVGNNQGLGLRLYVGEQCEYRRT